MANFVDYDNMAAILPHIKSSKIIPLESGTLPLVQVLTNYLVDSEYAGIFIPHLIINLGGTSYVSFNAPNSSGVGPIQMHGPSGSDYDGVYVGIKMGGTYNKLPSFELENVWIRRYRNASTGVENYYLFGDPDVLGGLYEPYGEPTTKIVIGDGESSTEYSFTEDNVDYSLGNRVLKIRHAISSISSPSPGAGVPGTTSGANRLMCTYNGSTWEWKLRLGGAGIYVDAVKELMDRYMFIHNVSDGPYQYMLKPGSYGDVTATNMSGYERLGGIANIRAYLLKE